MVAKGKRGWGGLDWEFGVSRCQLLHIEWINSKALLRSTGNYVQYPGVSSNGTENEKEYIVCVYIDSYILYI